MGIPIFLSNIAVQSSYSKQAMTLQILNRQNSLLNTFLNEIRNVELQNDRMRFRRNLERVGEIMAYEISKTFSYVLQTIKTPINPAEVNLPARDIVIATVLRAGLPFHQGFLNYFDRAESAFISARRAYNRTQETMEVRFDSVYTPRLDGKILLLVDPMLATGSSLVVAYKELLAQSGTSRPYTYRFGHRQSSGIRICRKNINRAIRISMDSSPRRQTHAETLYRSRVGRRWRLGIRR